MLIMSGWPVTLTWLFYVSWCNDIIIHCLTSLYSRSSSITSSPLLLKARMKWPQGDLAPNWPGWSARGCWASPWRCPRISPLPPAPARGADIASSCLLSRFWSSCHRLEVITTLCCRIIPDPEACQELFHCWFIRSLPTLRLRMGAGGGQRNGRPLSASRWRAQWAVGSREAGDSVTR